MSRSNPTIRRLCTGIVLALAVAGTTVGCGERAPRATPLPPGADVTLVDTSTPTTSPVIEGEGAPSSAPTSTKPPRGTTVPNQSGSQSSADRDLDQIEADLRQLDQDLSRSSLSEEGAVQ